MRNWKITWISGGSLREVIVFSGIYDIGSAASNAGVDVYNIIKIEQVAV